MVSPTAVLGSYKSNAAVSVAAAVFVASAVCLERRRRRLRQPHGLSISRLYVFPIKSCKGHCLDEAQLTAEGLAGDREYAVVKVLDGARAEAVSQREIPQMALVAPDMPSAAGLTVRMRGMRDLQVPPHGTGVLWRIRSNVWDDEADGEDLGDEVAAWFCEALGSKELRLVRFSGFRAAPEPARWGEGSTKFSDGFPMLVTSEASLAELAQRSGLSQVAERMRPNLVVAGCASHEEDQWVALRWARGGASAEFRLPKPCARCTMPRVDPATGQVGADPMKTLKPYRGGHVLLQDDAQLRHRSHYAANKGEIFFGQNINVAVQGFAVLRVGDPLAVAAALEAA